MSTDSPSSNAVDRALNILELVAERSDGFTNSEISHRLGIPKSSASYILRTLERRGYLRRDRRTGRYTIGIKIVGLAKEGLELADLRQAASPVLVQLVERTRLTAHLAILDHGRAVYIDRAEIPGFLRINTWVGKDLPVHSTAVGKVLTADLPEPAVRTILEEQGMPGKTPTTLTRPDDFLEELERVRTRGYAVDDEENSIGVRCVAAPVYDGSGRVQAAIGLSGASSQLGRDAEAEISRAVVKAALLVSRQMGFAGSGAA
ncbi:MAG: IclR family transcriptional regulator [Acidobacteria bacterium]|nr:IclR family transcriptional regulator [Acidobacteriota bacterium]